MSCSSTVHSVPPPTTHNFDTKQRNRLLRSARKLTSILGSTPQVAETTAAAGEVPPVPQVPGSRPTHRTPATSQSASSIASEPAPRLVYSSASNNSSSTSLSVASMDGSGRPRSALGREAPLTRKKSLMSFKSTAKRSIEVPPPLLLHLSVPAPKHHSLPQSPTSTTSTLTPGGSPNSSCSTSPLTPIFPTAAESRRKRMAKLTRTLGEKIPPQLVYATTVIKKASVPSFRLSSSTVPQKPESKDEAKLLKANRRRSHSVDLVGMANLEESPLLAHPASSQHQPSLPRSPKVWVTGHTTWRGEWNRKDIREVQQQLRNLKSR